MNSRRGFLTSMRRFSNVLEKCLLVGAPERPDNAPVSGSLPAYVPPCGSPWDTVIVLDVSGSMGLSDYPPTRLAGGVQATTTHVTTSVQRRPDDRIALVSFHAFARRILPLTPVTRKKVILDALGGLTADGGTDLAKGLEAVLAVFQSEPFSNRARHAIVLTDGQGGKPLAVAAKLKAELGVVIDVTGIGGSPSEVNEALLRRVATTEPDGSNHYRFIKDPDTLCQHYRQLAEGLVWTGEKS